MSPRRPGQYDGLDGGRHTGGTPRLSDQDHDPDDHDNPYLSLWDDPDTEDDYA